jgi:dTDP-glucose 4,6-dehydratase
VRDWLFVGDHCEAIVEVLLKGLDGQSYNIGGNNEKQNIEVVTLVCDLLDKKVGLADSGKPRRSLITYVKDRLGHDRRYAIDAAKIKNELGWEPKMTFEQGMGKTVDWYLEHQDWVDDIVNGSYTEYYNTMYNL